MHKLKLECADETGFSLITAVMCVVILSITTIGMYNAIIMGNRYLADSRRVNEATNIARVMLEKLVDAPECTDYEPQDTDALPNMRWEVKYLNRYGEEVPEYSILNVDPLTIQLTVFWQINENSRERSVQLLAKATHGLT